MTINLAKSYALKAARLFKSAAEAADSGEHIKKSDCDNHVLSFFFSLKLHGHCGFKDFVLLGDLVERVHIGTDSIVKIHHNSADVIHK